MMVKLVIIKKKDESEFDDFWLHLRIVKKDGFWMVKQQFITTPKTTKKIKEIKPIKKGEVVL